MSWHCKIKPALSISILNRSRMSLCLLRTLLPRVMTATEAERGLILLPIKCSCSARAYNRGSIPTPIPDLPGIGGPSPSPSPICRGSGIIPIPGSHRGFRALSHVAACQWRMSHAISDPTRRHDSDGACPQWAARIGPRARTPRRGRAGRRGSVMVGARRGGHGLGNSCADAGRSSDALSRSTVTLRISGMLGP